MDIKDILVLKRDLRDNILKLLIGFNTATEIFIDSVSIQGQFSQNISGTKDLIYYKVNLTLDI